MVHIAAAEDRSAMDMLCHATQAIDAVGIRQALIMLERGQGAAPWSAGLAAKLERLRCRGSSFLARVRALREELVRLSAEQRVSAVHLHGVAACLLGSQALKPIPLQGRVLYSPHLTHGAAQWTAALLMPVLQGYLERFDCAAMAASFAEASLLGRLLNRSAEVLPPHPVHAAYFDNVRHESGSSGVLAGGEGAHAVDTVSRLCVLLNSRDARVPFAWLGEASAEARAQLEAANVKVLGLEDPVERARALARTRAFVHVASGRTWPSAVAEAMAVGVPCVVSGPPPHGALVRHGQTGFVCASERDLLEKLVLLLRDRTERRTIGEAARAEARRSFTLRHFERTILRAYGFCRAQVRRNLVPVPSAFEAPAPVVTAAWQSRAPVEKERKPWIQVRS